MKQDVYVAAKNLGLSKKEVNKIVSNHMTQKPNPGSVDLYKAGTDYGTVSPKEIYKAGTIYGTISTKDII